MIRKTAASNKIKTAVVEEGVSITPMPVTQGEAVTIKYDGLLADSGAKMLYTHVGYGSSDNWSQIEDIAMSKAGGSWHCQLLPKGERVHFCFHDGANHWDNNHGRNWTITVHNGEIF